MNNLRIGILGMGFIGSVHYEVIQDLKNFEVIAISDPTISNFPNLPATIAKYNDYRALLDHAKGIDVVINALPTTLHKQAAIDSADCGLATLLEKPMAVGSEEAEAIKSKFEESGVKLMVGMTGRYHPEFVKGYEALGQIGDLLYFDERTHIGATPFPTQYLDIEQCGRGIGLTNGVHTMDRFMWYSGQNISNVSIDTIGNDYFQKDVEDNVRGYAQFSDGKEGRFSFRWTPHQEVDCAFEVIGSEGIIKVKGFESAVLIQAEKRTELYRHNLDVDFRERHKPGIKAELKAFGKFLKGNEQKRHVDDCIKAQRVIDQFYK